MREVGDVPIRGPPCLVPGYKLHDGPDRRVGGIRAGGGEFDVVDPRVEAIDDQMDPIAQFVTAKPPPQQPPGDG